MSSFRLIVRVDGKGRITLPLYIRRELGIEEYSSVELVVDQARRELIVRPITPSGEYLMNLEVELENPDKVSELVNLIIEGGGELKIIKCVPNPNKCLVSVSVIDLKAGENLVESLSSRGFLVKIAEDWRK